MVLLLLPKTLADTANLEIATYSNLELLMFHFMLVTSLMVCHMLLLNRRLFTKTLITSVIKGVTVIYILTQLKFETSEPDFLRSEELRRSFC